MPEAFVSLGEFLRPDVAPMDTVVPREQVVEEESVTVEPAGALETPAACDHTLPGVRRFRAALDDTVQALASEIVRDIATTVLARELQLAACDMQAIVARAIESALSYAPVRVRVHPNDAAQLSALGVPVIADDSLRIGDVCIDVRNGTIDASLGARLEALFSERAL